MNEFKQKLDQITQPLDVVDHKPKQKKPLTEKQKETLERGRANRQSNIKKVGETKKAKINEIKAKGESIIYNKPNSVSMKISKHDQKLDMLLEKISSLENNYKKTNSLDVPDKLIEKDKPLPPLPDPVPQEEINKPDEVKKEPENPKKLPDVHKQFSGQYSVKKYTSIKNIPRIKQKPH